MPCLLTEKGAICTGDDANRLYSRGFFGVMKKGKLHLSPVETAYLLERGRIRVEGLSSPEGALEVFRRGDDRFEVRYRVYSDVRDRGYYIRVLRRAFRVYQRGVNPFRDGEHFTLVPIPEGERFHPAKVAARVPCVFGIVDLDGDVTYYRVDTAEPSGEYARGDVGRVDISGKAGAFYTGDLSPFEITYLVRKGLAEAYVDGERTTWRELMEMYAEAIPAFRGRYRLYEDLSERGLLVRSGFKYGTHFRAYRKSMEEHAEYLAHYMEGGVEWYVVSRAVRLAHGVRKTLLFGFGDPVRYLTVERILL
jgi:tRNA-intron endonuclease